ncbi:serine hydrolase [Rubrivirga sp.]|uniref:serine hydrolase n=1 Tax=Rubrivirga sp. TaxID=1885344 RepID=UPI003C72C5BF
MIRLAPALLVFALAACSAPSPSMQTAPPSRTAEQTGPWPEPQADAVLQSALDEMAAGFDGVVGVYVQHLPTGRTASLRPDELFPTASMVKVPILLGVFDRIEDGELAMGDEIVFYDSLRYGSGELFSELRDSATVSLHSAVEQMLAASDNTASLWLQAMVTGEGVNTWLADNGFDGTRVNSRVPGRRPDWEVYGWGQTTPREMTEIVRRIVEGRAVSPAADLEMHRLLTRTHWDDEAIASLPPSVQAASKQGAVSESKSEVVYVHAPSGPYVFTVVTKEQGDVGYEPDNAGFVLIREMSTLFWNTFEPGSPWQPPAGTERFSY